MVCRADGAAAAHARATSRETIGVAGARGVEANCALMPLTQRLTLGVARRSQTASVTRGVLRIGLTFHDFSWLMTSNRSPSEAAQTGVGLGRPSLVKVVNKTYCDFAMSAKVGRTASI